MSIGKLAAGPAAGAYYEAALADGREDYYAGEGEEGGRWLGTGALGLDREAVDELLSRPREPVAPAEALLDDLTRHAATFDRRDVVQAVAAAHREGARRAKVEHDADRLLADAVPVQRANGDRAFTTSSVLEAERAFERRGFRAQGCVNASSRPRRSPGRARSAALSGVVVISTR